MMRTVFWSVWLIGGLAAPAWAQDVRVEVGKTEIAINEFLQVIVTVNNAQVNDYSGFPEINGFTKQGITTSTSTNIINGNMSVSQSIIQNYRAKKEGTYPVPGFSVTVNGKSYRANGATVRVGPARNYSDPFEDLFSAASEEPTDFINVKEDAFFAITTNKAEVYRGEGFNLTVAFYISNRNQAILEFHEVGQQLADILKKAKPANCWEENFGIDEITPDNVVIGGKTYRQYKIYQATFYPLNNQNVVIPPADFKMLKYKVARTQSFFGQNYAKDFRTFRSQPKTVRVKPLPDHPLRDQVAVGNFRLEEQPLNARASTGQSVAYQFAVSGEGNLTSVNEPRLNKSREFDFYPPNVKQQVNRGGGVVYGTKQFNYMLIPKEPGQFNLNQYFQWVYFNLRENRYDTLSPRAKLFVQGESLAGKDISDSDAGGFYDQLARQDNHLVSVNRLEALKLLANIALLGLIALAVAVALYRRRAKKAA
jgi:hypothetical protein